MAKIHVLIYQEYYMQLYCIKSCNIATTANAVYQLLVQMSSAI